MIDDEDINSLDKFIKNLNKEVEDEIRKSTRERLFINGVSRGDRGEVVHEGDMVYVTLDLNTFQLQTPEYELLPHENYLSITYRDKYGGIVEGEIQFPCEIETSSMNVSEINNVLDIKFKVKDNDKQKANGDKSKQKSRK